jgi:pimeloyl-ACP methyl ester carboxylesterase
MIIPSIKTHVLLLLSSSLSPALGVPAYQAPLTGGSLATPNHNISRDLFDDLEELSRIVDISYCVGVTGTGIQKPFLCASRCQDFPHFELVTTWNTGPFMSDSCGYVVLSHPPSPPRIIAAFRGTYSVANTIIDLSTIPQEYIPYPGDEDEDDDDDDDGGDDNKVLRRRWTSTEKAECTNCTVHAGFMQSWRHTRPQILSHLKEAIQKYPQYQLALVGHSLGGAVAALASLDFEAHGWEPQVTTFGEPRIGNAGLMQYIDNSFSNGSSTNITGRYRRVTHVDDPVPLLPLTEWGYQMHAGEVYISKPNIPPEVEDLRYCEGDEDPECIAGAETRQGSPSLPNIEEGADIEGFRDWWNETRGLLTVPSRFRIWQLFFAHRDYFWRLGLCLPGGDPKDWYRKHPHDEEGETLEL